MIQEIKGKKTPNDKNYVQHVDKALFDAERSTGVNAAYNYILKKQTISLIPIAICGSFLLIGIFVGYSFALLINH